MPEFGPLFPDEGEWAPVNPTPTPPTNVSTIPAGSITDDKLAGGISPLKISGVGIKVYLSAANQTITTGAAGEDITFDTVAFNQSFEDPGASFTTVSIPYTGVYLLQAAVEWSNVDTGGRTVIFEVNGTEVEGERKKANNTSRSTVTAVRQLSAGDTVGLHVEHDVGADTDVENGEDNCSMTALLLFSL